MGGGGGCNDACLIAWHGGGNNDTEILIEIKYLGFHNYCAGFFKKNVFLPKYTFLFSVLRFYLFVYLRPVSCVHTITSFSEVSILYSH